MVFSFFGYLASQAERPPCIRRRTHIFVEVKETYRETFVNW